MMLGVVVAESSRWLLQMIIVVRIEVEKDKVVVLRDAFQQMGVSCL